jgi:hypothetical protein
MPPNITVNNERVSDHSESDPIYDSPRKHNLFFKILKLSIIPIKLFFNITQIKLQSSVIIVFLTIFLNNSIIGLKLVLICNFESIY